MIRLFSFNFRGLNISKLHEVLLAIAHAMLVPSVPLIRWIFADKCLMLGDYDWPISCYWFELIFSNHKYWSVRLTFNFYKLPYFREYFFCVLPFPARIAAIEFVIFKFILCSWIRRDPSFTYSRRCNFFRLVMPIPSDLTVCSYVVLFQHVSL